MALSVSRRVGEVSLWGIHRSCKRGCGGRNSSDLQFRRQGGIRTERSTGSRAPGRDGPAQGLDIEACRPLEGADLDEVILPVSLFEEKNLTGAIILGPKGIVSTPWALMRT